MPAPAGRPLSLSAAVLLVAVIVLTAVGSPPFTRLVDRLAAGPASARHRPASS